MSPDEFVETLSPAVRQAAAIARALEGRVRNRPKPDEADDVKRALTIADTASQEALLVPLLEHFPDVRLEAEEDTPSVALFPTSGAALVVIDPIDGTFHFYLGGAGPYAVMVGLARRGRYDAALVALPREGLFFEAVRGGGARVARASGPPREARLHPDGRKVLVSHELPDAARERLRERGLEPHPGCGGAVAVAPLVAGVCAGLRMARPGADVSIRGRIGALIAREAGACVLGADGKPFPEEIEAPAPVLAVAASDGEAALLADALAAAAAD